MKHLEATRLWWRHRYPQGNARSFASLRQPTGTERIVCATRVIHMVCCSALMNLN